MWTSTTTRPFGRKAKFSQREMNIGSSGQRTWETSGGALWAPFVFWAVVSVLGRVLDGMSSSVPVMNAA